MISIGPKLGCITEIQLREAAKIDGQPIPEPGSIIRFKVDGRVPEGEIWVVDNDGNIVARVTNIGPITT